MRVSARFRLNEINGYVIDDGGLLYPVVEKGLYDQETIEGLIAEGYKVLNYHGDIITPDGINIKDIIESPCTLSEDEIQTAIDMADYIMTEAEATKYFSHDIEISEIKFKEPRVSISTREELISYLRRCKKLFRYANNIQDVRPLNSFVAKEALFTCEELTCNKEVKDLFYSIEQRRKLNSYTSYKRLIKFLQEQGVLGEEYSNDDIKSAYLSWGICGLKTPIVEMKTKLGVTSNILSKADAGEKGMAIANRQLEICLLDKKGGVHYSNGCCDLSNVDEFEQENVMPESAETYFKLLRNTDKWVSEYQPMKCLIRNPKTRVHCELLDKNGVSYTARIENTQIAIFDARTNIYSGAFLYIKMLDGQYVPLEKVKTEDDFAQYNLIMAKARDLVRQNTVKVPVKSSYELITKEGVSPESAVRYIGRQIERNPQNLDMNNGLMFCDAYKIYRTGPDSYLKNKYNPEGYEYETLDDLIDIMCTTRDEMEQSGNYLVINKSDNSYEAGLIRREIEERPLDKLAFVKEVKIGGLAIDNLDVGRKQDGEAEIERIADLIRLMIKIELNEKAVSFSEIVHYIKNIEDSKIIDLNKTCIRKRDAEYWGYLKDRAILNSTRAKEATELVYITKVFREASNKPISEQRHYMFECIHYSTLKDKNQTILAKAIESAINDMTEIPEDMRSILLEESYAFAASLIFKIMGGSVQLMKSSVITEVIVKEILHLSKNHKVDLFIKLPTSIVSSIQALYKENRVRCCTIFDWITNEVSSNNCFNLYCVNANINPWKVTPKEGYQFPSYNFILNYYSNDRIRENFGAEFLEQLQSIKAKVSSIKHSYYDYSLLQPDYTADSITYDLSTINCVLDHLSEESISNYFERWVLWNKYANSNGKSLLEIPLKCDVVFGCYAEKNQRIVEEAVIDDIKVDKETIINNRMPMMLVNNVFELHGIATGNNIEEFNFTEKPFVDILRWTDLLKGCSNNETICIYYPGKLFVKTIKESELIELKTITLRQAEELVERGILYQLNATHFLIMATNGAYELEVFGC